MKYGSCYREEKCILSYFDFKTSLAFGKVTSFEEKNLLSFGVELEKCRGG